MSINCKILLQYFIANKRLSHVDFPTFRYLDSLDYYMGRALEGMGSPAAKEYYQKFLDIKANADPGNPLVTDTQNRLSSF